MFMQGGKRLTALLFFSTQQQGKADEWLYLLQITSPEVGPNIYFPGTAIGFVYEA